MGELFNNIETLCKSRGITITTMCKESGAPRGSLTDLKQGRNSTLHPETLKKIASYFGVSVDYLLGNKNEPLIDSNEELAEELQILRENPETRSVLRVMKNMSPEQVRRMKDWISSMQEG